MLSAWPITGSGRNQLHRKQLKLALALRGTHEHYRLDEITRRHWNLTAKQCGYGTDPEALIEETLAATAGVIDSVGAQLPAGFPMPVFDAICSGLRRAARQLTGRVAT